MAYIGNIPAESYASFETETFSVSATTNYTLSHAVTNENEIRLVINGVVQQPGSGKAYTASGTTLTLTSATVSGDVMYAVYLGRALQTVNPPSGSVGLSQLSATGTKNATTFLRGDNTFASAGGTNTPAFEAYLSSDQLTNENAFTKVQCDTEHFDTDNVYDTSNYRFTPQTAGKYFVYGSVTCRGNNDNMATAQTIIYKNGSQYKRNVLFTKSTTTVIERIAFVTSAVIDFNGSSDYVELYGAISSVDGTRQFDNAAESTWFGAYKIIE